MNSLPIDSRLPEIVERLRAHGRLVLVAPPGAGKTTRVPPAILRGGLLSAEHPAMIVLQPRRVAARSTAARIAEEQNWKLGEEVGYQVRFERRLTARTRIRIQTEGILTRQLLADPFLESVGLVILDEVHERSIHSDLALALLNEIRREVRRDLMIVAMSATLDAGPVARFLGDCPIVRAEGRTHPVAVSYRSGSTTLIDSASSAVVDILEDPTDRGHVLVFLPGMGEIRRVQGQIESQARGAGAIVIPLHGSLSSEDQDRALRPNPLRKIILSTNIAETSLTIDGVSTVIDGGLARVAQYDAERGFDRLSLERISRASAEQRAGRAGRTGPGRCIRLWSEAQHRGLSEHEVPEIHRVDLCETVLTLHSWGLTDPSTFHWFETPTADRLLGAEKLLVMLGAIEEQSRRITPLGERLEALPIHPRLGRLLIAAVDAGLMHEGASLAALLSEKDLLSRDAESARNGRTGPSSTGSTGTREDSDLLVRLDLLDAAEHDGFSARLRNFGIDPIAARQIVHARDQLIRLCERLPASRGSTAVEADFAADDRETAIRKWLLLAYPDRVVKRRGSEETGVMVGGRGVRLDPRSVVREGSFFLAIDPREDRRRGVLELQVRIASAIEREWLETLHPGLIRSERLVRFDERKRRVVGVNEVWFQDLLLHEDTSLTVEPGEGAQAMARAIAPRARQWFSEAPEAADWLARVSFLRRAIPDLDLPEFADETFVEVVETACQNWGISRLEDLDRIDRIDALRGRLTRTQLQQLDHEAPTSLTLPNGRSAKLSYEEGRSPILAVRLQELFGWAETPRVARGRVPILLHLLGPNHRPVQITDDLRGFWTTTYFQVRKDLRGRYPKHGWPDDPLHAPPIARPKRG